MPVTLLVRLELICAECNMSDAGMQFFLPHQMCPFLLLEFGHGGIDCIVQGNNWFCATQALRLDMSCTEQTPLGVHAVAGHLV